MILEKQDSIDRSSTKFILELLSIFRMLRMFPNLHLKCYFILFHYFHIDLCNCEGIICNQIQANFPLHVEESLGKWTGP